MRIRIWLSSGRRPSATAVQGAIAAVAVCAFGTAAFHSVLASNVEVTTGPGTVVAAGPIPPPQMPGDNARGFAALAAALPQSTAPVEPNPAASETAPSDSPSSDLAPSALSPQPTATETASDDDEPAAPPVPAETPVQLPAETPAPPEPAASATPDPLCSLTLLLPESVRAARGEPAAIGDHPAQPIPLSELADADSEGTSGQQDLLVAAPDQHDCGISAEIARDPETGNYSHGTLTAASDGLSGSVIRVVAVAPDGTRHTLSAATIPAIGTYLLAFPAMRPEQLSALVLDVRES